MLVDKKKLYQVFETLSAFERKLMAIKIICSEYGFSSYWNRSEEKFVSDLNKAGVRDETQQALAFNTYKKTMKRLNDLDLIQKNAHFIIKHHLEHVFLVWLPEAELLDAFSVVDILYPRDKNNEARFLSLDENQEKTRVHLLKALYTNQTNFFEVHAEDPFYNSRIIGYFEKIFNLFELNLEIDLEWLASRAPIIQAFLYIYLLPYYFAELPRIKNNEAIITAFCVQDFTQLKHDWVHYYCAMIFLSVGDLSKSILHADKIRDSKSGFYLSLQATFAFLSQQFEQAGAFYTKALNALKKQYRTRAYYFDNILGLFHNFYVAFFEKNTSQLLLNIEAYEKLEANKTGIMTMNVSYNLLSIMHAIAQGEHAKNPEKWLKEKILENIDFLEQIEEHPFWQMAYAYLFYMLKTSDAEKQQHERQAQYTLCQQNQHRVVAHFLRELLPSEAQSDNILDTALVSLKLLDLISVKEAWEYSLQALEELLLPEGESQKSIEKSKRLLWLVNTEKQQIEVVEQSLSKSGKWSAGKAISPNKLKDAKLLDQFAYLTAADKAVVDCLVNDGTTWYEQYNFDTRRAFLALIGHPHVAHYQNRETKITLTQGEPELFIEEVAKGYKIYLSHYHSDVGLILEPESMNQYKVIDFSDAFVQIAKILTKKGLVIPAMAKEKVLNVIQHAKHDIKIHVELQDSQLPEIAGDATPYIQLLPVKQGIKATLWIKPVAHHGTYCKAGEGNGSLTLLLPQETSEKEIRTRIVRDLAQEKSNVEALLTHCITLQHHETEAGIYEMEGPEETLEALSELQEYSTQHPLITEWPQGQTFKIKQRLFAKSLSLNITSENNWFSYDGEVKLMDGEVINMRSLLEALDTSSVGRFVRLGNGEFLELTQSLKKQLRILQTISDGNRINALGAQVLSDIAQDAENTVFDAGWEAHLKKIKTMQTHEPKVPSTLQATLRDYQIEGFQYLSRLTHWGMGACLADDMGLGKTVQAICLLLEHAKKGPALVVAPTSVAFNWIEELKKFAPTLNIHSLRTADRSTLLEKAGKFDIVICSYGLLQHNEKLLSDKKWETIILDEAQAIKNAFTKRWKTVMTLKGNNRVALSGTPIENHLGELWSIFSFINPGLLGSIQSFQNKYATPIESGQSLDKVQALKTLVSPYILRRLKSEVLTELPPKTEQTIHVEQSKEEAVFYEALRQKAEERMRSLMSANDRLGVLAEITKLRQACCDSSLVDSAIMLENSKLNLFIETVKNIIANGHKALVFSQYVSFLSIVRKRIEAENIEYQYLDGSTSPAKRKKAVEEFQAGNGELFLLSLKAGGSGLNLTAADYVIHLDPWWNPAVEDQASDRAHRIGQERPVTIYRLVMQNTIEEKIIGLHAHKRNLANELLSGQGVSGKLSNEDLMQLIYREV